MAEKVVSVRLVANVQGFTAGMRKAKASVDDLTKADVPKAARAYGDLSNKAAIAGAAIATGLGLAVKRFADFDQAMSAVKANTGAATDEMEALRAAAIKLGADSQFSATEAAQGINELGKAGVKTADILGGGLKGALDLAAAGQISVAEAAETTASAMTQFGLGGDKAVHVADLLASGSNKAQGGVNDLSAALNQAGLVAASTGLSIEETTAGLTAFASAGLIGSDAGTSFKTMLQRLNAPADEAKALMKELGISAYDSQGQFVGLAEVAGQLRTAMEDMTPAQRNAAMATIFGSDAVRASTILYEEGAAGIAKWTDAVNEQGAAAEQAAALTDNLKGDLERLGGALDTAFIQGGSSANGALRTLVQGLEGFVTALAAVPGPVLLVGAGLTAAALAAPKALSSFRAVSATFESIAKTSPAAAKGVNAVTTATKAYGSALAAAAVIGAANELFSEDAGAIGVQGLTRDLLAATDAVGAFSTEIQTNSAYIGALEDSLSSFDDVVKVAFDPSFFQSFNAKGSDAVKTLTLGMVDLNNVSDEAAQRLGDLDAVLSGLVTAGNASEAARLFDEFAAAAARQGVSVDQLKGKLPGYAEALAGVDVAARTTAGSSSTLGEATVDAETAARNAADAWDKLKTAIDGLGSPLAQQRAASRDFQAAIDDAAASVKANGETLKVTTAEGRANAAALDAIRDKTLAKVAADYQLTGSTTVATATMQAGKDAFVAAAIAAGKTETQAEALATQLGLIPDDVAIAVSQTGAKAAGDAIDAAAVDRNSTIWVTRRYLSSMSDTSLNANPGQATGGAIYGPGSGTSDTAGLFRLSNGEHVLTAAEVSKLGGQGAVYALRAAIRGGRFPGLATGGQPQPQFAPRVQVVTVPGSGMAGSITETNNAPVNIYGGQFGPTLSDVEREAATRRRRDALSPARRG